MGEISGQAPALILSIAAGLLLGVLFFGGLWWTIRRGLSSKQPTLWFLGSLILRLGITLAGFYLVSAGRWERLVACLAGFIVARYIVKRLIGRLPVAQTAALEESGNAS